MKRATKMASQWSPREEELMELALEEAQCAYDGDEVPVGCVIVHNDMVIALGRNKTNEVQPASLLWSQVRQWPAKPAVAELTLCFA